MSTVVTNAEPVQAGGLPQHPVLVGYDGSAAAGRALAWAAGLARRLHQPLLVAYIGPAPTPYPAGTVDAAGQRAALLDWLRGETAKALPADAVAGVEMQLTCRFGDVGYELARLASEQHAEALVVGTPEHRLHRLVGSVSSGMARHAHCPVVVVP
jgi:nucleotide-binding universal stress UspA family protein